MVIFFVLFKNSLPIPEVLKILMPRIYSRSIKSELYVFLKISSDDSNARLHLQTTDWPVSFLRLEMVTYLSLFIQPSTHCLT